MVYSSKNILLIGIDGLRPDALEVANTPNIDKIISSEGKLFLNIKSVFPTKSGPNWNTIYRGVCPPKHLVWGNSDLEFAPLVSQKTAETYPNFFTRILNSSKFSSTQKRFFHYSNWDPIAKYVTSESQEDMITNMGGISDENATESLLSHLTMESHLLNESNADIMRIFSIVYDDVDAAGHSSGFDPDNAFYISTIEKTDEDIGKIIDEIYVNRILPMESKEEWMIVITTDHGGWGLIHTICPSPSICLDQIYDIFVIISFLNSTKNFESSENVRKDVNLLFDFMNDTSVTYGLNTIVRVIFKFVGMDILSQWNLDPVTDLCRVGIIDESLLSIIVTMSVIFATGSVILLCVIIILLCLPSALKGSDGLNEINEVEEGKVNYKLIEEEKNKEQVIVELNDNEENKQIN